MRNSGGRTSDLRPTDNCVLSQLAPNYPVVTEDDLECVAQRLHQVGIS
jgi:hypothetical protein